MVRRVIDHGKAYFVCECCGAAFTDKKSAVICEEWGKKHKRCDIERIQKMLETREKTLARKSAKKKSKGKKHPKKK